MQRFTVAALCVVLLCPLAAQSQKYGGTWRLSIPDNPPSASIQEETTVSTTRPFMPVFNNLVYFDQGVGRASAETIRPELASEWSWNADGTVLKMTLQRDVKWHDGKPFTSADVKCTWDTLVGKRDGGWRKNPHKDWYRNLREVRTNGDHEVSFHLARPQASLLSFLASGKSAVYPCHVDGRTMRMHPIGTGPFKVESFEANKGVRLVKNKAYWKKGKPYLDAIEYKVIASPATNALAFVAGALDWVSLTTGQTKDIRAQVPAAKCQSGLSYSTYNILLNHQIAPFNDARVRRALSLAIDRNAFVQLSDGEYQLGTSMLPAPAGLWGQPEAQRAKLAGYGSDVEKNRIEARRLLKEAGYGPDRPLRTPVSTRAMKSYQDASLVVMDQLRSVGVETSLDVQETSIWYANIIKKKVALGINSQGAGIDDPDDVFTTYLCGGTYNPSNYCNKDFDAKYEQQSAMSDPEKRRALVLQMDRMLQEDAVKPILYYSATTICHQPYVKGYTFYENGQFNHWRFEDVWLDK
jgi:peptide/nickel transport system substrate-binding protein